MKEAVQVYKTEFAGIENRIDNALFTTLIGTFMAKGGGSASYVAGEFIRNLPPERLYTGWDGEVYPKITMKKIMVDGD